MTNDEIIQYYDYLMRLATSKCNSQTDAEDLVGERTPAKADCRFCLVDSPSWRPAAMLRTPQRFAYARVAERFSITGAKKERHLFVSLFFGDPWENRTPVTAVKGRCLSRLTNGPYIQLSAH